MLKTFITSFKLENTYKVNSIIHSLKSIPLIKKILPYDLYSNPGLKVFGIIISILKELATLCIGKLFYVLFLIMIPSVLYQGNQSDYYLTIFIFLSLIGAIVNKDVLEATYEKYYAIILMKIDARKYCISNFLYFLLKTYIGFLPITLFFGFILDMPIWINLLLPFYVVLSKIIGLSLDIIKYEKTNNYTDLLLEKKDEVSFIIIFLICAYLLPILKFKITPNIFIIIFIIFLILSILSLKKIFSFRKYKLIYKKILTTDRIFFGTTNDYNASVKESIKESITYDKESLSNKKGFAFFHETFIKRHKKILTKAIKIQTIVIIIVIIAAIISVLLFLSMNKNINGMMLNYLPYFVFLMYIINRGEVITQAMFFNCDHSMLAYRIYRRPKIILGVFKERLKTLIGYNLIPALIIAIALPLLLFLTGGTENILNYIVLFVSIICMSIFFSVHYLVLYYLLQPYNAKTEVKNSTFHVIHSLTYVVCYFMTELHFPTLIFGLITIIFSILYIIIALILVYKLAPKTFKLRL